MLRQPRGTQRYLPRTAADEAALTERIIELARRFHRYGTPRITAMLNGEDGWHVNHKRVERIWQQEGLKVPPRQRKRRRVWREDGTSVRIYNDRGEIRVPARLDWGIKRGCVAVTNGWWSGEGGTVNFCSRGRETDMGHGAAFHDTLVAIERD